MGKKWMQFSLAMLALLCVMLLQFRSGNKQSVVSEKQLPDRFLVVLGIAQDAGYPQVGCTKSCCQSFWEGKEEKKNSSCLALVDRISNQYWLFDATPDITAQLKKIQSYISAEPDYTPDGIFLTHAHTGHYTGLMQLGREAMGAKNIPVYVLPRMDSFLRSNGPWSQLVTLQNIQLNQIKEDSTLLLNENLAAKAFRVPHRDEYSETAGYWVSSAKKKVLFIPDINKWEQWNRDLATEIKNADIVFIDGTFYDTAELPGRDMKEIPHPFVEETRNKLSALPVTEKNKVIFIHFNHINPLLRKKSQEKRKLTEAGFRVAEEGMIIEL